MNLTIAKRDLLHLAARMVGVAEKKSTMPVLASVLVRAEGTSIGLAATDLYVALEGATGATITTPGSVAVGAKDFVERVKTLPEGPITLTEKDGGLLIKGSGARKFTLRAMSGADFPPLPRPEAGAARIVLDVAVLASLISHTVFSISTDETRAHLSSALLEWGDGIVRMVSTDGHRLSKAERKVDVSGASSVLLPLKAIQELRRIVDDAYAAQGEATSSLTLIQSGSHAFFRGPSLTFGVKLVEAQFPPYSQVIPAKSAHMLRAPRAALLEAIKAVAIAADGKTGAVKLAVSKGLLRLFSASADTGEGTDELPIEYAGPALASGFAARYLCDVLGALSSDEVSIAFEGELDPIVIKPCNPPEGSDYTAVVMPMRI